MKQRKQTIYIFYLYGVLAASHRIRIKQFEKYINKNKFLIRSNVLLDNNYIESRFAGKKLNYFYILQRYFMRVLFLMRFFFDRQGIVIIQYELFPYLPFIFEKWFLFFKKRFVIDIDDAFYLRYYEVKFFSRFLRSKFEQIFAKVDCVIAGNNNIAKYASKVTENCIVLPSVVDSSFYFKKRRLHYDTRSPLIIGWVGSPSTAPYLNILVEPLNTISKDFNFVFVVVGCGTGFQFKHPVDFNVNLLSWSEELEIDRICDFDIGVMPLDDNDWTRGKCGYKLLQYMACGIPSIASPVGVNRDLLDGCGLIASTAEEWVVQFVRLMGSPGLRKHLGDCGYSRARKEYSSEAVADTFLRALEG